MAERDFLEPELPHGSDPLVPIDIADWDRVPPRVILFSLLMRTPCCLRSEPSIADELDAMVRAGLVEYRAPVESELIAATAQFGFAPTWLVSSTAAGRTVGLHLAASATLVEALFFYAKLMRAGVEWMGIDPFEFIAELMSRDRASDPSIDPTRWLLDHAPAELERLPRRFGLDPGTEPEVSLHAC